MGNSTAKMGSVPQEGAAHFHKLKDEITCSVCLHELSDPVSISCGHTFCRGCITDYWKTLGNRGYTCPECKKTWPSSHLIPAYRLRNMVTKVQQAVKEEQSRQSAPSALQLVYTDGDERLQLDESVLHRCFLESEVYDYHLCLICVIGEKRRGKSTLLNYILRALDCLERGQSVNLGKMDESLTGFEWRSGAESVTKGIWIWSKPFMLERNGQKLATFVLDTEGSFDIEGDRETNIKLSALSMLLSSYLIFNVNSCLKTTELDYMEMFLHVSELAGTSFLLQYLQHLDFLVRDWQDPDGCGPAHSYLQHESEKLRLRKSSQYRLFLDTLRSPSVGGFLLPHPGKRFLRSSQGRLADMDEDFRHHLTRYISDLVAGIWLYQKTNIRGEKITCGYLGRVLKEFVNVLQKKQYRFASPMQMFYSLENRKHMNDLLQKFQDFLDKQLPLNTSLFKVLGVRPSEMRTKVSEQAAFSLETYEGILMGDNAEEKEMLKEEMQSILTEKQERFCSLYSKRFTKCAVGIGCAVGGGVLSLAGGFVGAAVAGTVLAVEAVTLLGSTTTAVVTGAVGGSVTLGAVGAGVGAGVGRIVGKMEKEKDSKAEPGTDMETTTEDTQYLVKRKD